MSSLGDQVTRGKDAHRREIAGLGLRAMVADLPAGPTAVNMAKKLTPSLLAGLASQVTFCWPSWSLVVRLGSMLLPQHQ